MVIRHNEEYEKIEGCDDGVIMHLKSGKKLKADCCFMLMYVPVTPIRWRWRILVWKRSSRGSLKVNGMYLDRPAARLCGGRRDYQSRPPPPTIRGRIAAQALVKGEATAHLIEVSPLGFMHSGNHSSVGKTERQLTAMKCCLRSGPRAI